MPEVCFSKIQTNDKLPSHRLEYISLKIKQFIHLFEVKAQDWPLDCTKLIQKMRETQVIPFIYGFFRLPEKYEAITDYRTDHNVYLMQINRNRVHYPFETSADRRLNFTLAHEIGHIMLDHLKVPRNLKTKQEIFQEELEANEFAGRLLMPDKLLTNCNFASISAVAEFFNVSNSALWMRINKMYRFDLLQHKKGLVCHNCGNTSMYYTAKYCGICGIELEGNTNGVLGIMYTDNIRLNNRGEAFSCPNCNNSELSFTGRCTSCNTLLYNYCSKSLYLDRGSCIYTNRGNARYCEMCGSETYFYSIGILKPWEETRKNHVTEIIAEYTAEYYIFV